MKKIIKMFEDGNVSVSGLRGRGKDMLIANVICRRKRPYISNVNYGGEYYPLDMKQFECGRNTFEDFINGTVKQYVYPFPDGVDLYVSDAGVYFPSQHQGELVKKYPYFPVFQALTRQLGECNFHTNAQNLNRVWDKIREQSDMYIACQWVIKPFIRWFGIVVQRVYIYERYQSAVDRVPPFRIPRPLLNPDRKFQWEMAYQNYVISHGVIQSRLLIYRNKSNYDTRIFKEILANGETKK